MSRFHRFRRMTIGAIFLALLGATGCARPAAPESDDGGASTDPQQVPFHDVSATPVVRSGDSATVPDQSRNSEASLPFRDPQRLPAGTLLTVRLRSPISAQNPGAKATFEAVVDEAVVVEGNNVVPLGAIVAGRVESAHASNVARNRGYMRLALDSIHLGGVSLPISTSSLFVRGSAGETHIAKGEAPPNGSALVAIHLEKGRRLTFRLIEPAYVAGRQTTQLDR